jgi:hypothetical protein
VEPLAADDLILEVAADRAGVGQPPRVLAAFFRVGGISALEVDRDRKLKRLDNAPRIGQREVDRHLLAIGPAVGVGDRMAASGERLGPRRDHRPRAAHVPDIIQHHGIARHVQGGEGFEFISHEAAPTPGWKPVQLLALVTALS